MKAKIVLAVAVLLIVGAQIHYTLSQKEQPEAKTEAAAETPASEVPPAPAAEPEPAPEPEQVVGIRISGPEGGAVELKAAGEGWTIESGDSLPADSEKIACFLASLLRGPRLPPPLNADAAVTGIGDGGEVSVLLELADGGSYAVRVGLCPEGNYRAAFAAFGEESPVVLDEDIRGLLGLWRNVPGQTPEAGCWLPTRVFSFTPSAVARVSARYPDHEIVFERGAGGGWTSSSYVPGGEWDGDAVERWLDELSAFSVTGLAESSEADDAAVSAVALTLSLADGAAKTLYAARNLNGDGMHVASGDYPGLRFTLPGWRFEKYFLRMGKLFPKAVPRFQLSDIRLLDVRQGGDSVKIARQDGSWRLVGLPYALRTERVERLARLISGLDPEDYADPGEKPPRTAAGAPILEVILADGSMRQYRPGGRHPLFPWRYVTVDNASVLSLADSEAGVLFPGFEELLDLGLVFPGLEGGSLSRVELIRMEDGAKLLSIRREDGIWTAENERVSVVLSAGEAENLTGALPNWRVAGLFEADSRFGKAEGMLRLRVADAFGTERGITLLSPQGRDIPYMADGERAFLLDRSDFFGWLGAVRGVSRRIDESAAEAAKAAEAAEPAEDAAEEAVEEEAPPERPEPPVEPLSEPAVEAAVEEPESGLSDAGSSGAEQGSGEEEETAVESE